LSLKSSKAVSTNVRFRSWSSKPLSVNAALVLERAVKQHYQQATSREKLTCRIIYDMKFHCWCKI